MNFPDEDTAAPLVDIVVEDSLVAGDGAGMQDVVVVVVVVGMVVVFVVGRLMVVRWQSWVGNKKKKVVVAAPVVVVVVVVIARVIVVAGEIVTGSETGNENVNEDKDGTAAVGVDGGAKNEANMRPSLRLEVGKKSSSRRPGQLGSGQRQTGQNMNKSASDFGRRPGCGTS